MSLKLPVQEGDVDVLIREYLTREAAKVDVARLQEEIAARVRAANAVTESAAAPRLPWLISRASTWATAALVLVAVTVALYLTLEPEPASAFALVRAAQRSLEKGPDRCYHVVGRLPAGWLKSNPLYRVGEEAIVWTRGDRLLVSSDIDELPVRWGQDEDENFWFIVGQKGFSFRPGQTPPILNRTRSFLALNPRQLINWFLKDFELTIINDFEQEQPVVRIFAKRKPDSKEMVFDTAWIEVDPDSKLLRRLQVERSAGNHVLPYSLTFTFIEEESLPAGEYEAKSHLPAGGVLLGPAEAAERDRQFRELMQSQKPAALRQEPAVRLPVDSQ